MRRVSPALLAVLALVLTACGGGAQAADCDRLPGVRPGLCPIPAEQREPAPEQALAVLGQEGEELSVTDFRGQLLVVNFWASWCGPCRTEQPDLNDASGQLAPEVAFLGVAILERSEANSLAHEREFAIPYPSLFDPRGSYAASYGGIGPRTIPSTILIDPDGRVAARIFGITTATEVTVLADRILADG